MFLVYERAERREVFAVQAVRRWKKFWLRSIAERDFCEEAQHEQKDERNQQDAEK